MTEEIKKEMKEYFTKKEYDNVIAMLHTKIIVDESNYKKILEETLHILNSIRINRDISYHEEYVQIEKRFALLFTEKIYSFFIEKKFSREKLTKIHHSCAKFFNAVNSVTSIGASVFIDEADDPINTI